MDGSMIYRKKLKSFFSRFVRIAPSDFIQVNYRVLTWAKKTYSYYRFAKCYFALFAT